MKPLYVTALSLLLLLVAAAAPAAPPDHLKIGWDALAVGDLEGAEAAFTDATRRRKSRSDATAGLLSVALTRADDEAMQTLLKGLTPSHASELLILAAGSAERSLVPASGDALAWAEAACEIEAPQWPDEVRDLCTTAPLLRVAPQQSRCTAGCEGTVVLPFSYAGSQPVVLVAVNGSAPVPLLVDTGASSSLLTEEAASALGLNKREDTALMITATGGMIPSWRDLVVLELGEARIEDVEVLVADLPIAGLAGILSPQATWPGNVVEMDFVRHELRASPASGQELAGVLLPYRQHEERPYIELRTADRPARPVVIDTGAGNTQVAEAWEQLGAPLERGDTSFAEGAGGARSEVIQTTGLLEATAGALPLPLQNPTLYTPHPSDAPTVANFGLLGADAWMGRTLSIDRSGGRLAMTDPPTLPPWQIDDAASFSVSLDGAPAGRFTERVVARDEQTITLEVTISGVEDSDDGDLFTVRTLDSWPSRGNWMLTRPVVEAWVTTDAGVEPLDGNSVVTRWLPLFKPFGTVSSDKPPLLVFGPHQVGDQELSCTRLELPADAGGEPATFTMIECPTLPWRVVELGLVRAADGLVLWQVRQE